jgi:hypothetical protein
VWWFCCRTIVVCAKRFESPRPALRGERSKIAQRISGEGLSPRVRCVGWAKASAVARRAKAKACPPFQHEAADGRWARREMRLCPSHGVNFNTIICRHTAAISRRNPPELCRKKRPSKTRGRGECRVPNAPAASCALWGSEYAHEYSQRRHRKHPAFPTQWFYGLYVISPGTGLSCPRHFSGNCFPRKLSASVGAPGPHAFAVRFKRRSSRDTKASTASHPAFVTARTPLLSRRDGAENTQFLIFGKRNICAWRTDNPNQLESLQ